MKYIAVIHEWFVNSTKFHQKELKATNPNDADDEARLIVSKMNNNWDKIAYTVVEIDDDQRTTEKLNRIPVWIRSIFNAV